jgi:colicin import membrane protein
MGNPFKVKGTKAAAKATVESAQLQADAADRQAAEIRAAAEAQAAATRDAAAQSAASTQAQIDAVNRNAQAAADASQRQLEAMSSNQQSMMDAFGQMQESMSAQSSAQAAAAAKAAREQREMAAGQQQGRELEIARNLAVTKAQELLEKKDEKVDVTLASEDPNKAEIDPDTGRRRPTRASFMSSKKSQAGITI